MKILLSVVPLVVVMLIGIASLLSVVKYPDYKNGIVLVIR